MGFWAWFDFFSQLLALGQPLNHSLFLHQEMNPQVMGTAVLQTPGPGASRRRCSLRKSEGPGVQATAMTSSSRSIEVTTLATHGPIFLPHSIVLLSPQDHLLIGIPKMSWGTGDTPYPWDSSGCLSRCLLYSSTIKTLIKLYNHCLLTYFHQKLLESMVCLLHGYICTVKHHPCHIVSAHSACGDMNECWFVISKIIPNGLLSPGPQHREAPRRLRGGVWLISSSGGPQVPARVSAHIPHPWFTFALKSNLAVVWPS